MMTCQSGVYQIRNLLNGRVYVGSAVNLSQRKSQHWGSLKKGDHHSGRLQRAWRKSGADQFVFEVLERVDDKSLLVVTEQAWIDRLESCKPRNGYNVSPTAGSPLGTKHGPITCEKQTQNAKARWADPVFREKVMKALASPEVRAKRSRSSKAMWRDPIFQAERSRERKAIWKDPAYAAKISAARKKPDARARQSEVAKRLWSDPEMRERLLKDRRSESRRSALIASNKRRAGEVGSRKPCKEQNAFDFIN